MLTCSPRPPVSRRLWIAAVLGVLSLLAGRPDAGATPRPLPFTYPVETLPAGDLELELYVDMTPVRVAREGAVSTNAVTSLRSELQAELEYGITDKLELGLYFVAHQAASATSPYLQFRGIKQRLRYELSDPVSWPIGVGLYGEIAEYHDELEFEEKILLSRRFGAFGVAANLWVEQEYYFQDDDWRFIYNPTAGAFYEFMPELAAGLEYWVRGRFDDPESSTAAGSDAPTRARHYLGPTALLQAGHHFVSVGTYLRLDNLGEPQAVDDAWGRVYVRLLVGIAL